MSKRFNYHEASEGCRDCYTEVVYGDGMPQCRAENCPYSEHYIDPASEAVKAEH